MEVTVLNINRFFDAAQNYLQNLVCAEVESANQPHSLAQEPTCNLFL